MQSSKIKIGTCSWKYDSWVGLIYSQPSRENYLAEYAQQFNTVEVDQWFWSLFPGKQPVFPNTDVVEQYAGAVPDDFKFSIKVPNSITLTHYYNQSKTTPLEANPWFLSPDLFTKFLLTLSPMQKKIGPLMFQFEYLNKQKMGGQSEFLDKLNGFFEKCPKEFSYAIEIRNPNFLNKNYFEFIRSHKLSHVFLQGYFMPQIVKVFADQRSLIGDKAVIRLHGPNRKEIEKVTGNKWNQIVMPKDEELQEVLKMVKQMIENKMDIFLNVNNHYEGSAVRTIQKIREVLGL